MPQYFLEDRKDPTNSEIIDEGTVTATGLAGVPWQERLAIANKLSQKRYGRSGPHSPARSAARPQRTTSARLSDGQCPGMPPRECTAAAYHGAGNLVDVLNAEMNRGVELIDPSAINANLAGGR